MPIPASLVSSNYQRSAWKASHRLESVAGLKGLLRAGSARPTIAHACTTYRPARASDVQVIRTLVFAEKMNPLIQSHERFVVAVDREDEVLGAGQLAPLGEVGAELKSVVVVPEHRGKGIGSGVVRQLLNQAGGQAVFLTTISRRATFYEAFGFRELSKGEIPGPLVAEWLLGSLVARLAVQDRCIVMALEPERGR